MRLEPFQYQNDGIDAMREAFRQGKRRGILCMLMGGGKTVLSLELMRLSAEKGRRSLFLCDRRMLADQAVKVAREQGLSAGLIMAKRGVDETAMCQFASKQTLISWLKRGKIEMPDPDLVVVDEAHRATADAWLSLFKRWPLAYYVLLSATPCLGNGAGMGAYADVIIQPIKPSGLRELGRIVKVRAFAPTMPDLTKVKRDGDGDYSSKDLSSRLNRANLVGDVVGWWKRLGENRSSLYFACDVAHAMSICEQFRAEGVAAEMITEDTPDDLDDPPAAESRQDIAARSKSGEIKVVVSVDCLAEGVDWPWISCIGLVRPTKRLRRFLQMTGRGIRAIEGKNDCILIDHGGCVLYHGSPDLDREWPLSADDNADKLNQATPKDPTQMACVKCSALFSGSRNCPECGHVHVIVKAPKDYANKPGTLVEVSTGDIPLAELTTLQQRFWSTCIGVAVKRNAKAGMAAGMFRSKFGIPPWDAGVVPLPARRDSWGQPAREVFPGFVYGRRKAAVIEDDGSDGPSLWSG